MWYREGLPPAPAQPLQQQACSQRRCKVPIIMTWPHSLRSRFANLQIPPAVRRTGVQGPCNWAPGFLISSKRHYYSTFNLCIDSWVTSSRTSDFAFRSTRTVSLKGSIKNSSKIEKVSLTLSRLVKLKRTSPSLIPLVSATVIVS